VFQNVVQREMRIENSIIQKQMRQGFTGCAGLQQVVLSMFIRSYPCSIVSDFIRASRQRATAFAPFATGS